MITRLWQLRRGWHLLDREQRVGVVLFELAMLVKVAVLVYLVVR